MINSPKIPEIRSWLKLKNPLGLFRGGNFTIRNIDPKEWSGHFNFLVSARGKRFVLRFKGPEWGEPTKGIVDEYKALKYVQSYSVAPRPIYFTKKFFGEPMMLEEYVKGIPFPLVAKSEQKKLFSEISKLIAKINRIKFTKQALPFYAPAISYMRHKKAWRNRLKEASRNPNTRSWGKKIQELLPKADLMLDEFEPRLKRVLRKTGTKFIFVSAHSGHCLITNKGPKFLNWEQVTYGDPAYTLAVFLGSFAGRRDFREIRDAMVKAYLDLNPIPEFLELLDQRIKEREVSNLVWVLWAYAARRDARPVRAIGIEERFERVSGFLKSANF